MPANLIDPDAIKARLKARYQQLRVARSSHVVLRTLEMSLAGKPVDGLRFLVANLQSIEPIQDAVDDLGLLLMGAGQVTVNSTQRNALFQPATLQAAKTIGDWLTSARLGTEGAQGQPKYGARTFDQAVDLAIAEVSEGMPQPVNAGHEYLAEMVQVLSDQQLPDAAKASVANGLAIALLKKRDFATAVSAMVLAYERGENDPAIWVRCAAFWELFTLAATENLIGQNLPDWAGLLMINEARSLASIQLNADDSPRSNDI